MKKELSVIIPCYNHGQFIEKAIHSVLEHDDKNVCEIIIIDDGSTDLETIKILESISHNKIQLYRQPNKGLASARNKGIELAKNEYLLFLDSDNAIKKEFLIAFNIAIHSNNEFDAIYGNLEYYGERSGISKPGNLNLLKLFKGNYIDACSIIKKSTIIEIGKYDEEMPFMGWEDWDLWIRMGLAQKNIIYIDEVFFEYRFASDSMIRTIGHKENEIRKYLSKKFNLPFFDTIYLNSSLNTLLEDKLNTNFQIRNVINLFFNRLLKFLGINRNIHLTDNFF